MPWEHGEVCFLTDIWAFAPRLFIQIYARAKQDYTDEELFFAYRKAAAKGLLKVFSKIGICTLQSYKGAQIFETVGLAEEVVDRCFTGTASRIQGADFNAIYTDLSRLVTYEYAQVKAGWVLCVDYSFRCCGTCLLFTTSWSLRSPLLAEVSYESAILTIGNPTL